MRAAGIDWVEARDAGEHSAMHALASAMKNCLLLMAVLML